MTKQGSMGIDRHRQGRQDVFTDFFKALDGAYPVDQSDKADVTAANCI
jgi:hypothetical protein